MQLSGEGISNPLFVAQLRKTEKRRRVEINSSDYHKWKRNTLKISLLSLLASLEETEIHFHEGTALVSPNHNILNCTKGFEELCKKNNPGKTQSWEFLQEVPNSKGIPAHYQRLFPENPRAKHHHTDVKSNNDKKLNYSSFLSCACCSDGSMGDVGSKRHRHSRLQIFAFNSKS